AEARDALPPVPPPDREGGATDPESKPHRSLSWRTAPRRHPRPRRESPLPGGQKPPWQSRNRLRNKPPRCCASEISCCPHRSLFQATGLPVLQPRSAAGLIPSGQCGAPCSASGGPPDPLVGKSGVGSKGGFEKPPVAAPPSLPSSSGCRGIPPPRRNIDSYQSIVCLSPSAKLVFA